MSDPSQQVLDELRSWGGAAEMSPFEAVMWRAEADPRLRSTTTSVFILDRVPDWPRLHAGHEWLVRAVPRFRQRVLVPSIGVPVWVDDTAFNLDYHLRRVSLPAPGSERQLFDLAQTLGMAPFERVRPPWEGTLVEGLAGGRAAYILKMHHATSDGLGVIQLLSRVLGRTRESTHASMPKPAAATRPRAPSRQRLAAERVLGMPQQAAAGLSALFGSMRRLARDPQGLSGALSYSKSAQRMLAAKPVPGSPILKRRGRSWRFDGIEIPLDQLKAAARACEATLNDVFLAGLIGGFRRYHEAMGVAVERMPIGFPVSVRKEGDAMGGNKFAGLQYAAPIGERDVIARVRHIQAFVGEWRKEPALDVMMHLMPIVMRLPTATLTSLTAAVTASQDAQISNIPGIAEPVYLAGAQVTHFWPFAPLPGCAMMIVMITHNGRCCIGINSDQAAVIEPELMVESLSEGLQEVRSIAAPVTHRKPARTSTTSRVRSAGKKS